MSKVLSDLLNIPKDELAGWLGQLEHKAGYPSQDVRLLAAKTQHLRQKIASLGLDPDDTTGEELYHSLLAKYGRDCALVDRALGVGTNCSFAKRQAIAHQLLNHITDDSTVWAVKGQVLKTLIKNRPPKKTMRLWHYRSAESLIKREDPAEIILAALANESAQWQKAFKSKLAKVKDADYALQTVRVLTLSGERYPQSAKLKTLSDARLGAVALYPTTIKNLPVLTIALMLIKGLEKVCLRLETKPLAAINPTLNWWMDTESLLSWNAGRPIPLNIHDVALAHGQRAAYGEQSTEHSAAALMSDLLDGYKQYIDELPAEVADINKQAGEKLQKLVSPVKDLAFEAAEA